MSAHTNAASQPVCKVKIGFLQASGAAYSPTTGCCETQQPHSQKTGREDFAVAGVRDVFAFAEDGGLALGEQEPTLAGGS